MTEKWSGYSDLTPDETDLGEGWKKVADEPPARSDLILPYQYAPDRRPTEPRIEFPDGMMRELVAELREGTPVVLMCPLFNVVPCSCQGKAHRPDCRRQSQVRHAVESAIREIEQRVRGKVVLAPVHEGDPGPVTLDDKDGLDRPQVRFALVPKEFVSGHAATLTATEGRP